MIRARPPHLESVRCSCIYVGSCPRCCRHWRIPIPLRPTACTPCRRVARPSRRRGRAAAQKCWLWHATAAGPGIAIGQLIISNIFKCIPDRARVVTQSACTAHSRTAAAPYLPGATGVRKANTTRLHRFSENNGHGYILGKAQYTRVGVCVHVTAYPPHNSFPRRSRSSFPLLAVQKADQQLGAYGRRQR